MLEIYQSECQSYVFIYSGYFLTLLFYLNLPRTEVPGHLCEPDLRQPDVPQLFCIICKVRRRKKPYKIVISRFFYSAYLTGGSKGGKDSPQGDKKEK